MPIIDRDFPDAVCMPDGSLRIVTWAARAWLYRNTKVKMFCNRSDDVPRFVLAADEVLDMMRDDGLIIRTKKSSLRKLP